MESLAADGISAERVITALRQTPQSVILYDRTGRRAINTDLKDIQDVAYPVDRFDEAIAGCELAVLCNINFSRPFLARARALGIPVATDVHTIADLDDAYNRDFMAAASILFMSDESLPCAAEVWVRRIWDRYGVDVVVVGLGAQGALLGLRRDHCLERLPAVQTRPIMNTIGAGDALFSAFVHGYVATGDPYAALQRAIVFASYKIGETSASQGFLDEAALDRLCAALAPGFRIRRSIHARDNSEQTPQDTPRRGILRPTTEGRVRCTRKSMISEWPMAIAAGSMRRRCCWCTVFPWIGGCGPRRSVAFATMTRVITPDLRGHGKSEIVPGPFTMEQHADDLAALLDHLKIRRVVVAGLSMGGYVTFAFWRRYPARVQGLILADTRAEPDSVAVRGRPRRGDDQGSADRRGGLRR